MDKPGIRIDGNHTVVVGSSMLTAFDLAATKDSIFDRLLTLIPTSIAKDTDFSIDIGAIIYHDWLSDRNEIVPVLNFRIFVDGRGVTQLIKTLYSETTQLPESVENDVSDRFNYWDAYYPNYRIQIIENLYDTFIGYKTRYGKATT